VGDRACSVFPTLDYDKAVSTAFTNEFDTDGGSCWDNNPNCNSKYRYTFECDIKHKNCDKAYNVKNPDWTDPNEVQCG